MEDRFIDLVYQTVTGQLQPEYQLPGVEDSFARGSQCMQYYDRMLDAYSRLRNRLGVENEDEDVEIIINSLSAIEKEIAYQMYRYGVYFGVEDHWDLRKL